MRGKIRRNQILEFIKQYLKMHSYPPTYNEIREAVGLASNSSVHKHIKTMIDMGILETDHETTATRALRVPGYRIMEEKK